MSDDGSNNNWKAETGARKQTLRPPFSPASDRSVHEKGVRPVPPRLPAQNPVEDEIPATGVEAVRQALRRSALARREAQKQQETHEAERIKAEQAAQDEILRQQRQQIAALQVKAERSEPKQSQVEKTPPVTSPSPKSPTQVAPEDTIKSEKALAAAKLASATAEPSPVVKSRLVKVPTADTFPAASAPSLSVSKTALAKDVPQKIEGTNDGASSQQVKTGVSLNRRVDAKSSPNVQKVEPVALVPQAKTQMEKGADPLLQERPQHSIVPRSSVAGTALTTVIAIMAFLASLTLGAVSLVQDTAAGWQSDIAREVTIQLRPVDGVDSAAALKTAQDIASSFEGVLSVSVMNDSAMNRLLEPWLGAGLDLGQLPVPRLITVTVDENNPPDFVLLATRLRDEVTGASLDNHRAWVDRLTTMAQATVAIGLVVLMLMMGATVLMVVFATRGAMAGNAHVIELLHFVGAEQRYIAGQFQRHFLLLGLKGALMGGVAAIIFFLLLGWWTQSNTADPAAEQVSALFGTFSIGPWGFVGTLVLIFIIALLTALTSRLTVYRHIGALDRSAQEH